jgi:hypothetical protein
MLYQRPSNWQSEIEYRDTEENRRVKPTWYRQVSEFI